MDFNHELAVAAAKRWNERTDEREKAKDILNRGGLAEPPERIRKRLERLEIKAADEAARPAPLLAMAPAFRVGAIGHERTIGKRDLLQIKFLALAGAVARFVGRVHIREQPGALDGFGTGFMVSPRLLLTNNHVLPSASVARNSEIEFDFEQQHNGRTPSGVFFKLEPDTFFLTDVRLDYALVAVAEHGDNSAELKRYGWSRLIGAEGKALLGDALNIIQHPGGEAKQIAIRSNELIDLLDDFAHYITDTEPGSSGSPVYNDQWEVVALHHSGVPRTDTNGKVLAKDGTIWKDGMDPANIDWVANEGIRVSKLVEDIRSRQLAPKQRALRDELLELEPPHPFEVQAVAAGAPESAVPSRSQVVAYNDAVSLTIPLQVTLHVGTPGASSAPVTVRSARIARTNGAVADAEHAAAGGS